MPQNDNEISKIYNDLRSLAAALLSREKPGQTLQATALVHEAWMRIEKSGHYAIGGKTHYFRLAAEAMRRILVDRARAKLTQKRGAAPEYDTLHESRIAAPSTDEKLLAIHEALEKLEDHDPDSADLIKLRYFAGLNMVETADALDVSVRTAERRWTYAKAWIRKELSGDE